MHSCCLRCILFLVKIDVTCSEFFGEQEEGFDNLFLMQHTPPWVETEDISSGDADLVDNLIEPCFDLGLDAKEKSADHDDRHINKLK